MNIDSVASLMYLGLLAAVLLFWFITQNRASLGKTMQMAMAWVFIFIGVIAIVGLWDDIRSTVSPASKMTVSENEITVPRGVDGHYYLQLLINDTPVEFLVDTGASQIVLTKDDAERIGVDLNSLNFFGRALTANGEVRTAPTELDSVVLGPFHDRNLNAWVNEGDLDQSLLGMGFLNRFSSFTFQDGQMILRR